MASSPRVALSPEHRRLLSYLTKVREENGPRSLRQIGKQLHLAHSRVQALLAGKSLPADERQLRDLVRVGLGGSVEDAAKAVMLLSAIPRKNDDRRRLPRWAWAGPEAHGHFQRRGRGQRSGSQSRADLFHGREAAIAKIQHWLLDRTCRYEPLVVTGQPGAGKSAVISRAVLDLHLDGQQSGLAMHARDATYRDALAAVATLVGLPKDADRFSLLEALELDEQRIWLIVIDALDEVHSRSDRASIVQLIADLAELPCVRVVVATRPLAAGDRYLPGTLLSDLRVHGQESNNLVDLDDATYFDRDALVGLTASLLTQSGVPRPTPPGRAWQQYREDFELANRLAESIADRSERSFLVATLAAYALSTATTALDPFHPDFNASTIPTSVREAVNKYFDMLPDKERAELRGLLCAVAYARGEGIDDRTWILFAGALGYSATTADLDRLRDSAAADYLLQTTMVDFGEPVTRLFHEALAEDMRAHRRLREVSDEYAILNAIQPAKADDWTTAAYYARTHAADHAAAAGRLPDLLEEPHYLAVADLDRLLPVLPARPTRGIAAICGVLRRSWGRARSLPPARRMAIFSLTAAHLGHDEWHRRFVDAFDHRYVVRWAHSLGSAHQELSGHTGDVWTVAMGRLDDRHVLVSGGRDRTVRVWNHHGHQVGVPIRGHTDSITSVAVGRLDAQDVIVSASRDRTVRIWDKYGQPLFTPLQVQTSIDVVTLGRLEGRDVIVGGGTDGVVHIWDGNGRLVGNPLATEVYCISDLVVAKLGSRDVIVLGEAEGHNAPLYVLDSHGNTIEGPLVTDGYGISALAVGRLGEQDVILAAAGSGRVHMWDAHGQCMDIQLKQHTGAVCEIAIGHIDGRDVMVTGGWDADGVAQVCVWDPGGHPVGSSCTVRDGIIQSLAVGRFGDREVVTFCIGDMSLDDDEMVRVWDPHGSIAGDPTNGHTATVQALAIGQLDGHDVMISAGGDSTLRVWNTDGHSVGAQLEGHGDWIGAVTLGRLDGSDFVFSGGGGGDPTIRVWDQNGYQLGNPLKGHSKPIMAVAFGRLGSNDVIVSGSRDGAVRVWDARSRYQIGNPLVGHTDWVTSVTVGRFQDQDVIVSGGRDGSIQIWDQYGNLLDFPTIGHTWWTGAVALGEIRGQDVLVSGGDNEVRVWGQAGLSAHITHGSDTNTVMAVAVGKLHNQDVIVSGSWDGTVQIRYLADDRCDVLDLLEPVCAVGLARSNEIYIASGRSLCRVDADYIRPDEERTAGPLAPPPTSRL